MAEDRARQKRKRRKAQNVLPVNTKAKDTFFKKVCKSEEHLPEKVRYDIRLSESYLPAGEKYGENPPEPDLDATAHVYNFRMTLDETLRYIEQGELPDRFAAYDSDMREYALVANGINYVQRAGNDTKYVAPTNIRTVDAYVNQQNEYRYLSIDCFSIDDMEQLFLYEAVSGEDFRQSELARSTHYSVTDQWEIDFMGDEMASAEELHDMISKHMEGYEKRAISKNHFPETFRA